MNDFPCAECEEKLSEYLEGTLRADERMAVLLHLKSCKSCDELRAGIAQMVEVVREFPVYAPPAWLATRIVANTPPARSSLRGRLATLWQSLGEPRTALAIFTAAIVMGWIGGGTVREAVYNRAEGVVSCAYDRAIRSYYRSPVVIEIHSKLNELLETS